MDSERARSLLDAERVRVTNLLTGSQTAGRQDRGGDNEPGDRGDMAQTLTAEGIADSVAANLQDRLAALDRADQRLAAGTFGRSIRSGAPIPDERLEADPAAELTVAEAEKNERG
jgi:DnaK suppressor protein